MPSLLITGANRGIGLEFCRQYAGEGGWQIHATCRVPADAGDLRALPGVTIHPLDVTDRAGLDALATALRGVPLDVVIANAGMPERRDLAVEHIGKDDWMDVIATNTFAPLALATTLKANILAGSQKKLIAISSLMASIGSNNWGTQYIYRASKAGLNAVWRNLSVEWADTGIACVMLRPGLVRTRMTGFRGDLDPEETVSGMRAVIAKLTAADTGRFISYDGAELPW